METYAWHSAYFVFDMYEPYIPYKEIILLDQKFQRMEVYYLPILEEVDCLHEKSEYNLDPETSGNGLSTMLVNTVVSLSWIINNCLYGIL